MFIQHNYLRTYRKRSQLIQADIAFIMQMPDYSNISRWEQGERRPSIEMILVYHLLFDIPVESLFERQKIELFGSICKRIELRLQELKAVEKPDPKILSRISFLEATLTKLTS